MQSYLAAWGSSLGTDIRILAYEELPQQARLPVATYLFSDLERLGLRQRAMVAELYSSLHRLAPDMGLLNNPAEALCRFDLLQALHTTGVNTFRAHWATAPLNDIRFPVFLREENDHSGNLTGLINSHWDLNGALMLLLMRGSHLRNLLVVEFSNTADTKGRFNKYSAFFVGDRILPRHVMFSEHWMIKRSDILDEQSVRSEQAYLDSNDYTDDLVEIRNLSGITYGRIDFSVRKGGLQVWEINTNPIILQPIGNYQPERWPIQRQFARSIETAWQAIDHPAVGELVDNPLHKDGESGTSSPSDWAPRRNRRPLRPLVKLYRSYPSLFRPLGGLVRIAGHLLRIGNRPA